LGSRFTATPSSTGVAGFFLPQDMSEIILKPALNPIQSHTNNSHIFTKWSCWAQ